MLGTERLGRVTAAVYGVTNRRAERDGWNLREITSGPEGETNRWPAEKTQYSILRHVTTGRSVAHVYTRASLSASPRQ